MLSKEASSGIFWVFGMTRPGIEARAHGPLTNSLTFMPICNWNKMSTYRYLAIIHLFPLVTPYEKISSSERKKLYYQNDEQLSFSSNCMNLLCMRIVNFYINYNILSTPGDLYESPYIFSNWIIPNSSSFDIYIYIYNVNLADTIIFSFFIQLLSLTNEV